VITQLKTGKLQLSPLSLEISNGPLEIQPFLPLSAVEFHPTSKAPTLHVKKVYENIPTISIQKKRIEYLLTIDHCIFVPAPSTMLRVKLP
jgi:hypothetical protein